MVLKKRIYDGGFHGFLAPVIPKAPRSLRRRSLQRKSSDSGESCAFELLAAVAGKLLQDSESSSSSISPEGKEPISIPKEEVKHEPLEVKVKPVRSEHHDQESGFVSEPTNLDAPLNKLEHSDNDSGLENASIIRTADFLKKDIPNLKLEASKANNEVSYTPSKPVEPCVNTRVPNKSSNSVHLSFYRDRVPSVCFPRHRGNVKIDFRDDHEKYFRCNYRNPRRGKFGSRSCAGYRRIRKMLTSRYRKVAPKMKDYELTNATSIGVKSFYHKRKKIYMQERCQAEAACKRRKLFHHISKTAYIREANSESISKDSHVKFSIKSFKVPELYVEVPETATVGSLKRTVMEAVTAILQGKLHVGVLLQGKKVRDDNRTLEQTGISQNSNLETLGFTLEPSLPETSPSLVHKEPPLLLPCNTHQPSSRSPASPITDMGFSNSSPAPPPVTTFDNNTDKNQEIINFQDEQMVDSKALVIVPPLNPEMLSMVPLSEKPIKKYELSHRRTRRPFSVSEVEALVEAVEILGAGRWRDVKMRAFADADHRTYVDLKDKWKTLVHTASISPQQRRGEPVPQNLLDRVLAAHAYWSNHQSKQHAKHQKPSGTQT